ncbi:conserved hypothetical protein [Enterobacter sp. 638]|uniref:Uncharacterized protein n=1 Tax=Enterobacter sp. (strain 638) TaxID=399742 RepID=A0A9J9L055_ENT38|nr:conserved hypothetical protein [Enterobacter sp. 638]
MENESHKKQPYFIHLADGKTKFVAAIVSNPFERGDDAEGFLVVSTTASKALVDIHIK